MPGTWTTLANSPPATVCTTFLLTDGTVLAQGVSTNKWYKLTPDSTGNYQQGTWATMANSANAPLYYGSGILRDGRLIIAGGEYNNGQIIWLKAAEIYNPVANTWTSLPTPAGWFQIGDAPACVLPDGRFFLGQVGSKKTAIYDPATNAWTAAADKLNNVTEESWALLPDGTVHATDCSNPPNAEKYIIAANQWVAAGATPQSLVDSITEIGASVLLNDGRLLVIGATGYTALYTLPPIANQVGTWASGPSIPPGNGQALGAVDAPAAVMPNGKVLLAGSPITSPASFQEPTYVFEFDPATNSMTQAPSPATDDSEGYWGRMLVLPNGQVLWTSGRTQVELYTPGGAYDPVWRPTITSCPHHVMPGHAYTLHGRQLNGLTQCVYYGNDATQATNYPIVRLESKTSPNVYYCRTFDFSTMGLQTGTIVHTCRFRVPNGVPYDNYRLVVIANGIPSVSCSVQVSAKRWKELKWEIKEKFEIIEKTPRDVLKRVPEILGKEIREEIDILGQWEEEWLETVRTVAREVDAVQTEFREAFIKPEERPDVGPKPPRVEVVRPRRVRLAEIRDKLDKRAFNDGRPELPVPDDFKPIPGHLPHSTRKPAGGGITRRGATRRPQARGRRRSRRRRT